MMELPLKAMQKTFAWMICDIAISHELLINSNKYIKWDQAPTFS